MSNLITIESITWAVLLLPLLSFGVCLLVPNRYSWLVPILASCILLISILLGFYLLVGFPVDSSILVPLQWFTVAEYSFTLNLELNSLSILMIPVVAVISFLVHLFSIGYMVGDAGIRRYFAMLGFFTFAMLGVVLSNDLLVIFVFWELVGFSSYLLIGHWLEKPEAARAAQKAFLFNRIGDVGFIIGLLIIWTNTHSFNLNDVLYHLEVFSWQTAASLCIFCGVIGKSAQLPLFTWLPDAMEGPTPVSALIHAATMVAAGVFLLARVFLLFTPEALTVVAVVGVVTALTTAISALNQYDIKKILAYSTISQLGLMVTAIGAGADHAAMLHLFSHAFFKAGLFLAAGSVIHAVHQAQNQAHQHFDAQDIRNLGGLKSKIPTTFYMFVLMAASLAGVPLFSGFISKDSILSALYYSSGQSSLHTVLLVAAFAVSFLTVLYSFRLVWFIFFGKPQQEIAVTESPWIMRIPLIVLGFFSTWLIVSINPIDASASWFTRLVGHTYHSTTISFVSIGWIALALGTAYFMYRNKPASHSVSAFIGNGFGFDKVYQILFTKSFTKLAMITDVTDRKWIDGVIHFTVYTQVAISHAIAWIDENIVDGVVRLIKSIAGWVGSFTRSFQGGKIQLYIFWFLFGLIIFLFFILI